VSACEGHISVSISNASDRLRPPTQSGSSCLSPAATRLEHTAIKPHTKSFIHIRFLASLVKTQQRT